MPAWTALAPRAFPERLSWLGRFPQGKIHRICFALVNLYSGSCLHILQLTTAKLAVFWEFLHAEVHIPFQLIGIAIIYQLLHHSNNVRNMLRNLWIKVCSLHIQLVHSLKIALNITLTNNGAIYSLCISGLDNLVIHISKILNMLNLKALFAEISLDNIPGYKGTGITNMRVIIRGNTADIHPYLACLLRYKFLFFSS